MVINRKLVRNWFTFAAFSIWLTACSIIGATYDFDPNWSASAEVSPIFSIAHTLVTTATMFGGAIGYRC